MPASRRLTSIRSLAVLAIVSSLTIESGQDPATAAPDESSSAEAATPATTSHVAAARAPTLTVRTVVRGLEKPWDLTFTPNGSMLFTQRPRGIVRIRYPNGNVRTLVGTVPGLWVQGETGMMGIVVDPRFHRNRRFYICHGFENNGRHDVRVTAWRANNSVTSASQIDVVIKGLTSTSGRHGGCRLRFGGNGSLYIGTGDAAKTGEARDLGAYGGKVLRVNARTGRPWPTNPFINNPNRRTRKIYTYGHRNVQGLSRRPGGVMWSVEHGTDRDDEVNRLNAGGDYGWQAGPGYDESRPMTDHSLPGPQLSARWRSGFPTVATSGATWLNHRRWDDWNGTLAVAALKNESVRFMRFDSRGRLKWIARPRALVGTYGRLRTAQVGRNGLLYLTTDNGGGRDRILVVRPST